MATIITNRATVNYNSGSSSAVAFSNTTRTILSGSLRISKTSLSDSYQIGSEPTYVISIGNNSSEIAQTVKVTDDLGTFTDGTNVYTPLTYIGAAQLFINGEYVSNITPLIEANGITFEITNIPANGTAQIIYRTSVNEYACPMVGTSIINTACAEYVCNCPCDAPVCASATLTATEYADVQITKSVCPNPIVCGELLNYVFDIYNYGNIEASNVIFTDTFTPALENIAVAINGTSIGEDKYTYVDGVLTISAATGSDINIPAASCVRDAETGIVEIIPEKVTISVSGNV